MRYRGKVYKDGKVWLAEVPVLDTMTQGAPGRKLGQPHINSLSHQ